MPLPSKGHRKKDPRHLAGERYLFRLYVAGDAPNSARARSNLQAICDEHLASCYDLELVDILQDPRRALEDNILVTPTLVKLLPLPEVKLVGNLNEKAQVLLALGIEQV